MAKSPRSMRRWTVKEVRDGGIVGSGANGHRRALKEYLEIKNG